MNIEMRFRLCSDLDWCCHQNNGRRDTVVGMRIISCVSGSACSVKECWFSSFGCGNEPNHFNLEKSDGALEPLPTMVSQLLKRSKNWE